MVSEKAIVNAVIGLLATGGSTNHTMHLIAIARASGIVLNWDDFDRLSKAVPLITKIYPNGPADVNHFQAAGGIPMLKSIAGPVPYVTFCPTGGISPENYNAYLKLSNVACVGGSWLVPADAVKAKDWDKVTALAKQAIDDVQK